MTAYVYQGATAPEAVELVVAPSAALPDLSVVTAATITAERADGAAPATWTADITAQSSSSLTLRHVLADGDVDWRGALFLTANLATPGGTRRTEPARLEVRARVA